jgi:hypothetical protein
MTTSKRVAPKVSKELSKKSAKDEKPVAAPVLEQSKVKKKKK